MAEEEVLSEPVAMEEELYLAEFLQLALPLPTTSIPLSQRCRNIRTQIPRHQSEALAQRG